MRFDGEHLHEFDDRFLGPQVLDSEAIPCDFIVKRRDGLYAYQLAAAVGDAQPQFNSSFAALTCLILLTANAGYSTCWAWSLPIMPTSPLCLMKGVTNSANKQAQLHWK